MVRACGLLIAGAMAAFAWHGSLWLTLTSALLGALALAFANAIAPEPAHPARTEPDEDAVERILNRAMLDQAPTPLVSVADSEARALNRAARLLFAADDVIVSPPIELIEPSTPHLRRQGRSFRLDRVVAAGPQHRTIIALIDFEGEERAAEARATRELLETLGHELLNGLAPIVSLAESGIAVLDRPDRRDALLPEILDTLGRQAASLLRFARSYRTLGRLPEPRHATVGVAEIIEDLAIAFRARWGEQVRLSVEYPPNLVLDCDRAQLAQALGALLQNAAEAAGAGANSPAVDIRVVHRRETIAFRIGDNGPGFSPETQKQAFRVFFTSKPNGSGIGLGLARQIALAHGGDVSICDQGGRTNVELTLPDAKSLNPVGA